MTSINACDAGSQRKNATKDRREDPEVIAKSRPGDLDGQVLADAEDFCRVSLRGGQPSRDLVLAWEKVFATFCPIVRHIAKSCGIPTFDSDDCVQEAWIEIIHRLGAGNYDRQRGRFFCWVYTLVRNKTIDFQRMTARQAMVEWPDLDLFPTCRELDPAETFERERLRLLLHEALAVLPRRMSAITYQSLYRYWIEGADNSQLTRELGLTEEQVRYRRRRAKQCLRDMLRRGPIGAELEEPAD